MLDIVQRRIRTRRPVRKRMIRQCDLLTENRLVYTLNNHTMIQCLIRSETRKHFTQENIAELKAVAEIPVNISDIP